MLPEPLVASSAFTFKDGVKWPAPPVTGIYTGCCFTTREQFRQELRAITSS